MTASRTRLPIASERPRTPLDAPSWVDARDELEWTARHVEAETDRMISVAMAAADPLDVDLDTKEFREAVKAAFEELVYPIQQEIRREQDRDPQGASDWADWEQTGVAAE